MHFIVALNGHRPQLILGVEVNTLSLIATWYLPDWAQWLAQDEDGTWWAYEAEPNQQHNGWYENEVGRVLRLGKTEPPPDWQATLRRIT